uniref:PilZ domain-containing protein n=1 Tax=Altererythrobacter segetis TaxID=1104773 RepID=UPI003C2C9995
MFEVSQLLETEDYIGRRAQTRRIVDLRAQVRCGSETWRPIRVVDLSSTGFRLSWLPSCSTDCRIWLRIEGLEPLPATIRWKNNGGVGCEFIRPLSAAVLDHLSRRQI